MSPVSDEDGIEFHDLGGGHRFAWLTGDAERFPTDNPLLGAWRGDEGHNLVGIIEEHRRPDGTPCQGSVSFLRPANPSESEKRRPTWDVISTDPLELAPSIQCTAEGCGSHGFIRGGRWVSA